MNSKNIDKFEKLCYTYNLNVDKEFEKIIIKLRADLNQD